MRGGVFIPYIERMDQFLAEIERYSRRTGIDPARLLRDAINAEWGRWQKWRDKTASPRADTMDKVRAYMAANPPVHAEGARQ